VNISSAADLEAQVRNLIRDGKVREAANACDQLNQQFPEYGPGWYTTSRLALMVKEPLVALQAIQRAVEISPDQPEWLLQRIECVGKAGDLEVATSLAKQLADHFFDTPMHAAQFGKVLSYLGLLEDAKKHYLRACELDPDASQHYFNLAAVLHSLGEADAARRVVDRCLEINPDEPNAHLLRANLRTKSEEDNNVAALEAAYERSADRPNDRVRLSFALAKELEDLGNFRRSFEVLAEGNALRRQGLNYDLQKDLDKIYAIRDAYSAAQFERDIVGHINAEPIFVIGLPRTGVTLVERVLESHSVVTSYGETMTFPQKIVDHCMRLPDMPAASSAELASKSLSVDYAALGEDYIAAARPATSVMAHFVDAQPLNFMYMGFIRLALPKARMVLLQRDPMDTCYAIFRTLFANGHPYSNNLEELAHYLVAYRKLTDHWLAVIPEAIHVVKFEELLSEPRPVIENLLEYCSLSFEESCVGYFEASGAASSPAAAQTNRAFSRASIGSWKSYAEQLQPVADILAEAGLLAE
jgi:tetratricopeptide (TPR) repeat protein